MIAHRDDHLDMLAAQVAGCLDEADRFELEAHLASGCAVCAAERVRLEEGAALMAASAPPRGPSPALRALIMERVRADVRSGGVAQPVRPAAPPDTRAKRPSYAAWAWAAAAAALAIVAYVSWHASERLQSQVATTRAELDSLTRTLDSERRWNGLLNSRDARLVALESTPADSAGLRGRVMYDPASRRAVVVLDHAAARPGSDYELWAIRGGTPVSLGLLRADPSGLVTVRIEDAGPADTLQAFAVSLERAGGSPNPHAPSGPVVMLGKLGG